MEHSVEPRSLTRDDGSKLDAGIVDFGTAPSGASVISTQATDRAYRIGQNNPVFVHKLLCQDTVEERIHKLQQEKGKLAAGILSNADISNRLDAAMVRTLLEG